MLIVLRVCEGGKRTIVIVFLLGWRSDEERSLNGESFVVVVDGDGGLWELSEIEMREKAERGRDESFIGFSCVVL